jgi:predicted TIM-barrel fold metal-dependent hydrolase
VDFPLFDADNHYYEAEDAFTRYASERMRTERFVRWLSEGEKRRRLFFGDREANVIGNPTFDPVGKPGAYATVLKAIESGGTRATSSFGELVPLDPAYRDRELRLKTMDRQGVERAFMFPTLGVTVEGILGDDADMLCDCIHAFNQWLDEDWGFDHQHRIYAAPYLSMIERDRLVAELEWALDHGAKLVTIRPGPAYGRSPADPYFDPFWARVEESGVLVTYHAFDGRSAYTDAFRGLWNAPPNRRTREYAVLERAIATNESLVMDTMAALVLHNLFGRFPGIRVATVELGASWVPFLLHRLDHAGGLVNRHVTAWGVPLPDRPSAVFRDHVWVSPFPEEDIPSLVDHLGSERILFGSDWPHLEGTQEPADYADALRSLDAAAVRRIMRDNALALVGG